MAADFADIEELWQDAMGAWLAADAGIAAAFAANPVRILAATDDRTLLPCLQTGEDEFRNFSRQGVAAQGVTSRVHVWTRETGMTLCKRIGGAVRSALSVTDADGVNNGLVVPGYRLVYGFNVLARYMRDPAENMRHGVLDFEMRFAPAA